MPKVLSQKQFVLVNRYWRFEMRSRVGITLNIKQYLSCLLLPAVRFKSPKTTRVKTPQSKKM